MANEDQAVKRKDAVIGRYIELVWVHFENGTINPQDVLSIDKVEIYNGLPFDSESVIVQVILGENIIKSATGTYSYIMDPILAGNGGKFYYDKITYHLDSITVEEDLGYVWVSDQTVQLSIPVGVLRDLRIYLHDDNPNKDYRFSPPEFPDIYRQTSRKMRYVWEDHQLDLAYRMAISRVQATPPSTMIGISTLLTTEYYVLLKTAYLEALLIKVPLWINEEFDYSIGGLNLALNKSEKYKGLMDTMESQMNEFLTEWKKRYRGRSGVIITYTGVYGRRMSLRVGNPFPSRSTMSLSFW